MALVMYQTNQQHVAVEMNQEQQELKDSIPPAQEHDADTAEAVLKLAQQAAGTQDSEDEVFVAEVQAQKDTDDAHISQDSASESSSLVHIISPNGGENIMGGMSSIVWEVDEALSGCAYTTYLKRSDGARVVEYNNTIFNHHNTATIKNDSMFSTVGLLGDYRAHIDVICSDGTNHSDQSDGELSFVSDTLVASGDPNIVNSESVVKVLSPNGSDDIASDINSITVSWRVSNDVALCSPTVRLVGGIYSQTLEGTLMTTTADGGSHKTVSGTYGVPDSLFDGGTYYRAQVDMQCEGDTTIFRDNSDDAFQLFRVAH